MAKLKKWIESKYHDILVEQYDKIDRGTIPRHVKTEWPGSGTMYGEVVSFTYTHWTVPLFGHEIWKYMLNSKLQGHVAEENITVGFALAEKTVINLASYIDVRRDYKRRIQQSTRNSPDKRTICNEEIDID